MPCLGRRPFLLRKKELVGRALSRRDLTTFSEWFTAVRAGSHHKRVLKSATSSHHEQSHHWQGQASGVSGGGITCQSPSSCHERTAEVAGQEFSMAGRRWGSGAGAVAP